MSSKYDVVVVGLGIYGSSVVVEAGERGWSVLGVDAYRPPHSAAASHGNSRIFRQAIVESDATVNRARRALDLWKKLDTFSDDELLIPTEFALVTDVCARKRLSHNVADLTRRAVRVAEKYDINHRLLSGWELRSEYPALEVEPEAEVYLEREAFLIRPEAAVATLLHKADLLPTVDLLYDREATDVKEAEGRVSLTIGGEKVECKHLVLATGAWQHQRLVGCNPIAAKVFPQVSVSVDAVVDSARIPAFAYAKSDYLAYGTPATAGLQEIKVGLEQSVKSVTHPAGVSHLESFLGSYERITKDFAGSLLPSVSFKNARSDRCNYTVTPDSRHIVRRCPGYERVTLMSTCSGHGFKFAPAIAESTVGSISF